MQKLQRKTQNKIEWHCVSVYHRCWIWTFQNLDKNANVLTWCVAQCRYFSCLFVRPNIYYVILWLLNYWFFTLVNDINICKGENACFQNRTLLAFTSPRLPLKFRVRYISYVPLSWRHKFAYLAMFFRDVGTRQEFGCKFVNIQWILMESVSVVNIYWCSQYSKKCHFHVTRAFNSWTTVQHLTLIRTKKTKKKTRKFLLVLAITIVIYRTYTNSRTVRYMPLAKLPAGNFHVLKIWRRRKSLCRTWKAVSFETCRYFCVYLFILLDTFKIRGTFYLYKEKHEGRGAGK